MQNRRPFEILATRFGISGESAKYFLIRVQKSFRTEKPPHQLILGFMEEQAFESLPEPYHVAEGLRTSGLWVHPLNAPPPSLVDDEDPYAG